MPKTDKYTPKHRAPGRHKAARTSARVIRRSVVVTGVAAAATGVAVSGGLLEATPDVTAASANISAATPSTAGAEALEERAPVVSRSDRRGHRDATKAAALSASAGTAVSRSQDLSQSDPRDIARALLPEYGFSADQFACLDSLYVGESNWRVDADNPTSSAYGIPQALTQLHDLPADYMTSAESQIRWGLEYIAGRYGTPCNADSFKRSHGFY